MGRQILQTLMQFQHAKLRLIAACRNPDKLPASFKGEVRAGDLRDPEYLDRMLVNVDVICHAASWSSYLPGEKHSRSLYLDPSLELIQHAIEWRVKRFVNLSSMAVTHIANRDNALSMGRPKRSWPMLNCMLTIEDFMNVHSDSHCQMINLRAGILAGAGLHNGLLPSLLHNLGNIPVPRINGGYQYMPIVDVKDLAQAFARAALAPGMSSFESFNITGPEQPSCSQVFDFIKPHAGLPLPLKLANIYSFLMGRLNKTALWNENLLHQMSNPLINIEPARQSLGYDPEVSWQASLQVMMQDAKSRSHPALQQAIKPLNL